MKRLSGGRGEYEIAENAGAVGPHDLVAKRIRWKIPPFRERDSGIEVREQGAKPRLRIASAGAIHIHRQLAAIALLPKPIRDETSLVGQAPVFRENQYILRRIDLGEVRVAGAVTIRPRRIEADNGSGLVETLEANDRLSRVKRIHELADEFSPALRAGVRQHEALLATTVPLDAEIERVVAGLTERAAREQTDYGMDFIAGTDVLPFLESVVGLASLAVPSAIPDDAEDVEYEIRLREASRLRRWASVRGVSSARFRRAVREAYDSRCVMCGMRLPPGPEGGVAGVDAAHILPWAAYDLDVTANGLCLCKLHHWAFDQQILMIDHVGGGYRIRMTERARRDFAGDAATLAQLASVEGDIPEDRLPNSAGQRPRPQFLERLYAAVPPDPV